MTKAPTDHELVEAITRALQPWSPQLRQIECGEIETNPEPKKFISEAVGSKIAELRTLTPAFFHREAIRKTRDDARAIMEAIDRLSGVMATKTLSPELKLRLGLEIHATEASSNNLPVPSLVRALSEVRGICQSAEENQPQADQVKRWCATIAIGLINRFSTERPSAGSDQSAYCTIAGLIYESVTGKEERLRGVCHDVLKSYQPLLRI